MITLDYGNKSREIKVLEPLHENEMNLMKMYGKIFENEMKTTIYCSLSLKFSYFFEYGNC